MQSPERTLRFHTLLGRGGFGAVYLATLHGAGGFRRRVAVKLLHAGMEAQADLRARQRDEARLLGLLHHPALVQVLELATVAERPAVVMEYVEALDLAALQGALPARRLPLRALAELIGTIADALHGAWRARDPDDGAALRVVHRDIKPSNLLLTPEGRVKVLDFGVARFDADHREGHTSRVVLGTPRYMAPESWIGATPDHALDVYALGATAWELWTGRPWERAAPDRAAHDTRVAEAASLHTGLPRALHDLLTAMVAWEPTARPSAGDVHATLSSWCAETGPVGGDPLSVVAARHVPALLAARRAALADEPIPSPTPIADSTPVTPLPSTGRAAVGAPAAAAGQPGWRMAVIVAVMAGLAMAVAMWPGAPPPGDAETPAVTTLGPRRSPERVARLAAALEAAAGPPVPSAPTAPSNRTAHTPSRPDTARPRAPTASMTAAASRPEAPDAAPITLAPTPDPLPPAATSPFRIVTVPPEATVWLDGRAVGTTPVVIADLTDGAHRVEVELDGARARTDIVTGDGGASGVRYDYAPGSWRTLR